MKQSAKRYATNFTINQVKFGKKNQIGIKKEREENETEVIFLISEIL